MRTILLVVALILPVSTGCTKNAKAGRNIAVGMKDAMRKDEAPNAPQERAGDEQFVAQKDGGGKPEPKQPVPPGQKKPKVDQPRKIKYTADFRLIVKDFTKAEEALDTAIKESKGTLKSSEVSHTTGSIRTGTWRIRVPVENFNAFRTAVTKLGDVERNTVDSEDITAQYYDLDAHIKNRIVEREAIRDLLKEIGKQNLKHFLEIKRELDSITDDINRKEGQLRLWANLTDLTTITVHLREQQRFIAEKKVEDKEIPTFGTRASETWRESGEAFVGFLESLAIVGVAVTPWLPVPLVLVLMVWVFVKLLIWLTRAPAAVNVVVPEEKT